MNAMLSIISGHALATSLARGHADGVVQKISEGANPTSIGTTWKKLDIVRNTLGRGLASSETANRVRKGNGKVGGGTGISKTSQKCGPGAPTCLERFGHALTLHAHIREYANIFGIVTESMGIFGNPPPRSEMLRKRQAEL